MGLTAALMLAGVLVGAIIASLSRLGNGLSQRLRISELETRLRLTEIALYSLGTHMNEKEPLPKGLFNQLDLLGNDEILT